MDCLFYLGTHRPHWLWDAGVDFPLFVSRRTLSRYVNVYPSTARWALDSGGFSELSAYGGWATTPEEYVRDVAEWDCEIGNLDWAAPQDWMCEPAMIAKTGLSVAEHQRRTVDNFVILENLWPEFSDARCPFVPVLQGWVLDDYERCLDLYYAAEITLNSYPAVGLGSVCRRQSTSEIGDIVQAFSWLPVHGFGVKTRGLQRYGGYLTSADSLAWSYNARKNPPMPGHSHRNCANCLPFAAAWRQRLLAQLAETTSNHVTETSNRGAA